MLEAFEDIYVIEDPAQRKALTSPLRLEILEHFLNGPMAVADLAARMGRRPDSLYYHVRTLVKVGILLPAGTRKSGKRDEALYRVVAPSLGMGGEPDDPHLVDDAVKALRAGFRMSERELRDAMESGRLCDEGDQRNHWCARQRCRLRPSALKSINKHLAAMQKIIDREFRRPPHADEDAQLCSFTVALIPLADADETD